MEASKEFEITTHDLIHAGVQNLGEARDRFACLAELGFSGDMLQAVLISLQRACDPDTALKHLVEIFAAYEDRTDGCVADDKNGLVSDISALDGSVSGILDKQAVSAGQIATGQGPAGSGICSRDPHNLDNLVQDSASLSRLIGVLGASDALGSLMRAYPDLVSAAACDPCGSLDFSRDERIAHMSDAVKTAESKQADTPARVMPKAVEVLRRNYYLQLAAIMAEDTSADDPVKIQPQISAKLSDLADAAIGSALDIARTQVEGSERCGFTVIGMGKLGAQELNYVSDCDLVYVVEPLAGEDSGEKIDGVTLTRIGTRIGTLLQKICQSVIPGVDMPPLWQIDTALRPEGKDGPLVRTVDSCRVYYEKWANNWEFQALLKARVVAGDEELGKAYLDLTRPLVWSASKRDNFVYDCQKMRKRVEDNIAPDLRDREIKLGKGGLRDVEFTVQMLQLVHGRSDESLRGRSTLGALQALALGGYVARPQAARLDEDYRFERVLEHRAQMWQLKRTHLFPEVGKDNDDSPDIVRNTDTRAIDDNPELRRMGRAFGLLPDQLVDKYDKIRLEVRRLHTDIYYRPMLPINARLDDDQVTLSDKATRERFESIGFADPDAAMRHVRALTEGVSRAAKINRILLPSILQWLAQGQNPDMGLLQWRKLEERFGGGSQYLGFLRDSPQALIRLCHILSNSRLLGDSLNQSIESVTWLGDDDMLMPRTRESLDVRAQAAVSRYADNMNDFATSIRSMRRHEIERIGLGWTSKVFDDSAGLSGMTDVYDAGIESALLWSISHQCAEMKLESAPVAISVIAMGRYGGCEVNFCSDADIIMMYRPKQAAEGEDGDDCAKAAADFARNVVNDLRNILQGPASLEPKIDLDFGLRPEGKNGPLIRSYESCRDYYTKWYSTWERQALLRARYAAGDAQLARDFLTQLADPLRYMDRPLTDEEIGEIRKLKARMEAERLPHGVKRNQHLKLGAGGLSDVEWTVQLLQLEHAGEHESLRVNSTLTALDELERLEYINANDADALRKAWKMLTAARNGNYLWGARLSQADVLPSDFYGLGGVATFLGYDANRGQYFGNDLQAVMRRCREVTERLFYGL
ncbi:bifunctional [glutamine synthetase] adenylyltransferase/[glutamine synthetase]-adenylyl-L-tyrosine phosphorylase [Bifidobacterium sp. ESL0728]|uniref:bifunctional [glutamine synthetase] adenylyltransferase/[glutamine synthetase]-adenylyl-L-tyrosine phosphorylase n=1 Tax=Bifidobacterium sp. ESL0728 TaxID=2983220 RepID=UPI0023F690E8|nr:bifunctional [glutamine synthetase] adenylyltransferase/[glutamine synthetase]-adenylyl-L-tyrosine phosphorylase [Bifidobacterium sp. ESL0728]WEV59851.1 bifunctional [glutamine synthetase] adenylyltransferase/[glutamine synthetase]-adenylyl-L-tyrosine phosphorylase [Bifidobacterium sp. ESL0728]